MRLQAAGLARIEAGVAHVSPAAAAAAPELRADAAGAEPSCAELERAALIARAVSALVALGGGQDYEGTLVDLTEAGLPPRDLEPSHPLFGARADESVLPAVSAVHRVEAQVRELLEEVRYELEDLPAAQPEDDAAVPHADDAAAVLRVEVAPVRHVDDATAQHAVGVCGCEES